MPAQLSTPIFQALTPAGLPGDGYLVYTYAAGTSTPLATYPTFDDAVAGTNANANPVELDASGQAAIWLTDALYKIVLHTDLDVPVWSIDNVTGSVSTSGGGSSSGSEWVTFAGNPTYISATQFSLSGDQTASFSVARRVRTANTGGTVYSTIIAATFSSVTTVTVVNDSGSLDSGLSAVALGIITPTFNNSLPIYSDVGMLLQAGNALVSANFVNIGIGTESNDRMNELSPGATGNFIPKVAGVYRISGNVTMQSNAASTGISGNDQLVHAFVNNVDSAELGAISWPFANSLARIADIALDGTVTLPTGPAGTLDIRILTTFTGTAPAIYGGSLNIRRIA